MIVGFQVLLIGLVSDVMSGHRKLTEDLLLPGEEDRDRGGAGAFLSASLPPAPAAGAGRRQDA